MRNKDINQPGLWQDKIPKPQSGGHKYDQGWALILAARELTGATRLAASAAAHIGAGLTSIYAPKNADIFRAACAPDIMVQSRIEAFDLAKVSALCCGPGGAAAEDIRRVQAADAAQILDANAIDYALGKGLDLSRAVLTPHAGEFARNFPGLSDKSPQDGAAAAARQTRSVLVLKGPQTVIAAPDGRMAINAHASPHLAKAGTGDVLAGMITGLIAQGMDRFDAACCAVWVHGEAGLRAGPYLMASDLPPHFAGIMKTLTSQG